MEQTELFAGVERGADISECGKYRFTLWRIWNSSKPLIMFIGLNPSTADANKDDRTIRRCTQFVKDWGYGGFYMLNLFAFRTTYPTEMKQELEPIGYLNNQWLRHVSRTVDKVVFAWGCDGSHLGRDKQVIEMFPTAYCMGRTVNGNPLHPLFLPKITQLIQY